MKKYLLGLWIFLLAACQEERLEQGLQSGFLIALSEIESEVETRTAPAGLPDPVKTEFKVTIRNQETDKQQTVKWSEEVVPAEPGTYTLTAEFGENPDLGFDQPYYKGEKTDQTVRDGYTTEVSIPCEVANALVSIRIKEEDQAEFEKNFPDAYVKISVGNVKDQMWTDLNTSAYFKAGSTLSQLLLYKGHETGELDLLKEAGATVPKPFQAKDHLIITLGLQGQNGNLSLVVEKAEIKEENISETIPMEWLPAPKVSATGFDEKNTLTIYETEEASSASIDFNVAQPLQDLYFKLKFEDENLSSLNKGEEEEYQLSEMSEEEKSAFTSAGIILPSIGSTEPQIIFSEDFISKLLSKNDGTVSNVIVIDSVKANDRINKDESPLSYTIAVNKPEFTVSAYPGNIWTKEFTMNALMEDQVTEGDFSKLSANMKYQFSTNGESDWTDLGEDLRKADLIPGRTYYVRGLYRGKIASKVIEVKTYPIIELQNGSLTDYSIVKGKDGDKWNGYGSQFEWTGWATLNELTTPKCTWTAYSYNTRSGTRPINDVRNGSNDNVAVWIITIGYGYGGTNSSPKNVTPSELFLGTYNTKGIEYNSHPTGVKFFYKYTPYDNDKSDIFIQLLNNDIVLGEGSLQETNTISNYIEYTMNINYKDEYKHLSPNKISLVFKSGFNTSVESREEGGLTSSDTANPKFRGSELYIDDISLVYDK